MSCYRVTHVDMQHRRRRMAVRNVANRQAAIDRVEQLYGHGWYVCAIRLGAR